MEAVILSIQVGAIRKIETEMPGNPEPIAWKSAIFKEPVLGPIWASKTHLDGDAQANRRVHGGPDKAVYLYPHEHYAAWQQELGLDAMPYGGLGENLTTMGLLETEVCIGDVFRAGQVLLQVSEPRRPCYKISRRWRIPDLQERIDVSGRTGWYLRVLDEGPLEAGMSLVLANRLAPEWTVARVNNLISQTGADLDSAWRLVECPYLSESCRAGLIRRIDKALRRIE